MSDNGTLHELKVVIRAALSGYKKDMAAARAETKKASEAIKAETDKISSSMGKVGSSKARAEIEKLNNTLNRQKESIQKQENVIAGLKRKYDDLIAGVSSDRSVSGLEKQLKGAQKELDTVMQQYEKLSLNQRLAERRGDSSAAESMSRELEELSARYDELTDKVGRLKALLEDAKLNPQSTATAEDLIRKIEVETAKLERLKNEAGTTKEKLDAVMTSKAPPTSETKIARIRKQIKGLVSDATRGVKGVSGLFSGISSGIEKIGSRIKGMLASVFVFSMLSGALSGFKNYMGEALKTNAEFANSLNIIKANLMTAFAAIYNAVLPAINAFMSALATLTSMLASLLSKVFGTTYQKSMETAKGFKTAAAAAGSYKKATEKGQVFSFDEVHNINKDDDSDSGSGAASPDWDGALDGMEKSDSLLDKLKDKLKGLFDYLKGLWDIFKDGFKAGLGNVSLEPLKEALRGIKQSLIDIFTDPAVVAAADRFAKAAAFALGQIVGSAASIGISIATNFFGGINKYLDQNKDLIKKWLVNMFDIGTETVTIAGNFAQAVANIFSVVGSDTGQQLTANIIGIFANGFGGVLELAAKLVRDLTDVFATPIIVNQEGIKDAFTDLLEFLESVTGTVKELVDNTVSKANEVYDSSIGPTLQNIRDGLTDTMSLFLDTWNGQVKPILDELGQKFNELVNEHIQPMVDSVLELVGAFAEEFGNIYDSVIKPFMDWIAGSVVPVLAEISGDILTGIMDAIGWIADRIADLNNFLNEHRTIIDTIIVVVLSVVSAIAIVKGAIGVFMGVMSVVSGVIAAVKTAILGLQIAFAVITSPIGLVVAAIAAVIAIGVLLYTHWEEISAFASSTWEAIKETIGNALINIQETFTEIWNGIVEFLTEIWLNITETITEVWNGIVEFFTLIWEIIVLTVQTQITTIQNVISTILYVIFGVFNTVWNGIKGAVTTIISAISNTIKDVMNTIHKNIVQILSIILNKWIGVWTELKNKTKEIFDQMWNAIKGVINSILSGVETMANGVINAINAVINALNNLQIDIPDWIPGIGGETLGFSIPTLSTISIPRLAKGGIVDKATPLIAGEAGREAIVPLENNTGWMDTFAAKIADMINSVRDEENDENDEHELTIPVTLEIDAEKLDERLVKVRTRRGRPIAVTEG